MRGAIKYFLQTPLKTQRADWAAYKKMRNDCAALRASMEKCRANITRDCGYVETGDGYNRMNATRACIREYSVMAPTDYADGILSQDIVYMQNTCDKFDDKWCTNYNCAMVYKNHLYLIELAKYNAQNRARKEFWAKKFANVK